MNFLPIVERELRVAARRRSTYWLRVTAALVTLVIASGFMILHELFKQAPFNIGSVLFGILTWMSFAAVCSAGLFFTSDCLSEEKREGTLGLLFLTDLRGYDVVLGKLMAISLRSFYGLLAIFPIVAITLMMGGVAGGEFWRKMLALTNALFFSLAAGVFVSSISRESQRAMSGTLLLLVLAIPVLPVLDALIARWYGMGPGPVLSFASIGFAFVVADQRDLSAFWLSIAVSNGFAWLMLAFSSFWSPRSWQERSVAPALRKESFAHRVKYGNERQRTTRRHRLMDKNPVLWLTCRERWQGVSLGIFLVLLVALLVIALTITDLLGLSSRRTIIYVGSTFCYLLMFAFYLWVSSQASRFFVEGRRTGTLELLLASPLTVRDIVRGQWAALRRMFLVPVGLVILAQLIFGVLQFPQYQKMGGTLPGGFNFALFQIVNLATSTISPIANLLALSWVGMWMGLTSKKANMAVLKTILFVMVIPAIGMWFAQMFLIGIIMLWASMSGKTALTTFVSLMPAVAPLFYFALNLGKDVAFIFWARRKLETEFRAVATQIVLPVVVVRRPPLSPTTNAPPVIVS